MLKMAALAGASARRSATGPETRHPLSLQRQHHRPPNAQFGGAIQVRCRRKLLRCLLTLCVGEIV